MMEAAAVQLIDSTVPNDSSRSLNAYVSYSPVPVTQEVVPLRVSSSSLKLSNPVALFSHICESKKDIVDIDAFPLDSETLERQSVINNKVREILKTVTRPPSKPIDNEASEYIDLASRYQTSTTHVSFEEKSVFEKKSKNPAEASNSTNEKDSKHSSDLSSFSSAGTSSFSVQCPPLTDGEPPWFTFMGFARQNVKRLKKIKSSNQTSGVSESLNYFHDWRAALDEMNENLDFFGRLHEELYALISWLEPTPEEILLRQRILAKITIVAKSLWPRCTVIPFGSYFTSLWLPTGDMDIAIMGVEGPQILNLKMLTLCLIRLGIPLAVEVISSARVPIVKFVDSESGLSVDVSLNTDSAMATSDYIHEQMKVYPWLRPLILILKLYLCQRNLGETYRGGIGSYLLFVLCLSFLQQHRNLALPKFRSYVGLGHLIIDFFQLYGRDFNYDTTAISVRDGGRYFPKTENNWFNSERPSFLAVESPLAPELDIGRNSFEIRTVRSCFRQSFLTLVEKFAAWNDNTFNKRESIVKCFIFTSDPLMTRRKRVPLMFSGTSKLEASDWWQSVKAYFNQPIALPRPKPYLSAALIQQVEQDILAADNSITHTQQGIFKNELRRKKTSNEGASTLTNPQPDSKTTSEPSHNAFLKKNESTEENHAIHAPPSKKHKYEKDSQIIQLSDNQEVQYLQRLLEKKKTQGWEETV